HIQPVPSRHGVHWPQLSCLKKYDRRAIALMISVDLSITITAAVPNDDLRSRRPSKSIGQSMISSALTTGHDAPPGMTAKRLSQPPRMPPPCFSTSSRKVMPISSSTVHGVLT